MKQQLYNLFFTSPLEQFENNSLVVQKSTPVVPEVYINWFNNFEYYKMMEVESEYFFEPESFFYFQDKALFVIFFGLFCFGTSMIVSYLNNNKFFSILNSDVIISWLVTKFFLFFMFINNI